MSDILARGYAIASMETLQIDVKTVSATRRGALVNWLFVECGVFILNTTPDFEIEQQWIRHSNTSIGGVEQYKVIEVEIGIVNETLQAVVDAGADLYAAFCEITSMNAQQLEALAEYAKASNAYPWPSKVKP